MDYLIVLFKNKKRKKIINKFKTLERAKLFYNQKIKESELVYFDKKVENANECDYELGIVCKKDGNFEMYYIKDPLGRQLKVDVDDDYKIIELTPYNVPESIYDVTNKTKIFFEEFIKKYLLKKSLKLISKLQGNAFSTCFSKITLSLSEILFKKNSLARSNVLNFLIIFFLFLILKKTNR